MATWRKEKTVRNATPKDIAKLTRWDIDWTDGDLLDLLAERVNTLSHDKPPDGYRLALEGFLVVAKRSRQKDYVGLAFTAAGAAARRMGHGEEAHRLYDLAEQWVLKPRSRGRLLLSRATLALYEKQFSKAESFIERSRPLLADNPEDLALLLIVRANVRSERYYMQQIKDARRDVEIVFGRFQATIRGGSRPDIESALEDYTAAVEIAENGSDLQAVALFNMLAFMDLIGGPDAIEKRLNRLDDVRARMKALRSRGSRKIWAYVDWIEGALSYRRGAARAGRRFLVRAGERFKKNGVFSNAMRVAVDLVEFENSREEAKKLVSFESREFKHVQDLFDDAPVDTLRQQIEKVAAGQY